MTDRAATRPGPRLAPGGSAIPLRAIARALRMADARTDLERALRARFPGRALSFHASGREAMRVALVRLAEARGRDEIAIPAYGCFSMPASVVAAGLRVRLVDVDARGQLAAGAIEKLPLERIAAIVVGNLFGLAEPIDALARRARAAGVAVVDDAAQALGSRDAEAPVGSRGDVGILSFGRGKPLSALGGGAAVWRAVIGSPNERTSGLETPRPASAGLRALAYDVSRQRFVLGLLAGIPALGIGRTVYDPAFAQGAMDGAAVALAAALAPEVDVLGTARRATAHALAARIAEATAFEPLLERPGTTGVYPRLGLLAPSASRRDRALGALTRYGATAMYPTPMDAIRELEPHRVGDEACPGARDFCARLLTLPTHSALRGRAATVVSILSSC
ncbi:MAG: aminotransferase class V-fold PLP-dependent enzyme [Myxococcota bacterium]